MRDHILGVYKMMRCQAVDDPSDPVLVGLIVRNAIKFSQDRHL